MSRDEKKEKIIAAARELFSKNGYNATSTASIAKHAGVNNALIFYYFESKEKLFQSIFSEIFHSYRDDRNKRIHESVSIFSGEMPSNESLLKKLNDGMNFLDENEDLLRILMRETIKKSSTGKEFFEINKSIYGDFLNSDEQNRISLLLKEVFLFAVPNIMYTLLKTNISNYLDAPIDLLEQEYVKIMSQAFSCIFEDKSNNKQSINTENKIQEEYHE